MQRCMTGHERRTGAHWGQAVGAVQAGAHPCQGSVLLENGVGDLNRDVSLRCWPAILCYVQHNSAAACGASMHCFGNTTMHGHLGSRRPTDTMPSTI